MILVVLQGDTAAVFIINSVYEKSHSGLWIDAGVSRFQLLSRAKKHYVSGGGVLTCCLPYVCSNVAIEPRLTAQPFPDDGEQFLLLYVILLIETANISAFILHILVAGATLQNRVGGLICCLP